LKKVVYFYWFIFLHFVFFYNYCCDLRYLQLIGHNKNLNKFDIELFLEQWFSNYFSLRYMFRDITAHSYSKCRKMFYLHYYNFRQLMQTKIVQKKEKETTFFFSIELRVCLSAIRFSINNCAKINKSLFLIKV